MNKKDENLALGNITALGCAIRQSMILNARLKGYNINQLSSMVGLIPKLSLNSLNCN